MDMLIADRRDPAAKRFFHYVRGVKPASEADLQNGKVHALLLKI